MMETLAMAVYTIMALLIIGIPTWYIWKWNIQQHREKDNT